MKDYLSLAFVVTLLCLPITGCGGDEIPVRSSVAVTSTQSGSSGKLYVSADEVTRSLSQYRVTQSQDMLAAVIGASAGIKGVIQPGGRMVEIYVYGDAASAAKVSQPPSSIAALSASLGQEIRVFRNVLIVFYPPPLNPTGSSTTQSDISGFMADLQRHAP